MGRLFGTDGVRGLANREVTAELALDLAVSAAHVLVEQTEGHRPLALVARDPRASGEFIEAAITAGLASAGVDVVSVGVVPTPCLAYLTRSRQADLGVMISASHNPMPDNGIKFFARGGHKLDDAIEDAIEARIGEEWERPLGASVGRVSSDPAAAADYRRYLLGTLDYRLNGLRIVVDCANGAASHIAPETYRAAGAEVIAIHADPDGRNINDGCGSTHMGDLVAAVRSHRADAGIAHDGDADRCLAVDANGDIVDGDHILAILAMQRLRAGTLPESTVVATVMANLGFKHAMRDAGIAVVETAVGDRYVLEAMRSGGYLLGGEQSGHIVMTDLATTGDGLLTALHLLSAVAASGRPLAELAAQVAKLPQVLVNVSGVDKGALDACEPVAAALAEARQRLGSDGRVLLRPSGTEPLVRVMVEAPTPALADEVAQGLAEVVREHLTR